MVEIKKILGRSRSVVIEEIRMKKSLTLFSCVSILCSVTGHISVFVAPTAILKYTGSVGLSLILWIFGGVMNLFLALCFTELATMFPKAGGPYFFILKVFGPFSGFMIMWGYILLITGPFWAFVSYCASLYILQLFFVNCEPPDVAVKLFAVWILVSFVAINCVYVKLVTKIQSILTLTKILALLLIIVCGAISLATDGPENISDVWEGTVDKPIVVAMAFFFSVFTFGGWQIVVNLMEEVKNPGRDLPRAIHVSFLIITLEFVLVNLAYYVVLTKREILQSAAIAVLFFEKFYSPLKPVLSILVAVTAIGVLNASILGHSRVLLAAARNNQAPFFLSMISTKFFTPWPAIFALLVWSSIMLLSGELFTFMELISLFSLLLSLSVVVALLYLRWKQPHAERPYKASLYIPISQLVLLVVVFMLCVYEEPYKLGRGLVILAAGIPFYIVGVKWKSKPKIYTNYMERLTLSVQKTLLVSKSE
ncbi:cystine/glutamate transporter-like [Mercenaria mercenaria]|uniref:cystine/glutamate transporter-like n=1 Tax=Mercenaria mercenaria TaxID=6596 RepID=UPI00234EBF4B|nr:cystine/glutamate transporter-like [Mercenaria mercenaria]